MNNSLFLVLVKIWILKSQFTWIYQLINWFGFFYCFICICSYKLVNGKWYLKIEQRKKSHCCFQCIAVLSWHLQGRPFKLTIRRTRIQRFTLLSRTLCGRGFPEGEPALPERAAGRVTWRRSWGLSVRGLFRDQALRWVSFEEEVTPSGWFPNLYHCSGKRG